MEISQIGQLVSIIFEGLGSSQQGSKLVDIHEVRYDVFGQEDSKRSKLRKMVLG